MESLSARELIEIVEDYDKGGPGVRIEEYDDALEQLHELEAEGDEDAEAYFADLKDVD